MAKNKKRRKERRKFHKDKILVIPVILGELGIIHKRSGERQRRFGVDSSGGLIQKIVLVGITTNAWIWRLQEARTVNRQSPVFYTVTILIIITTIPFSSSLIVLSPIHLIVFLPFTCLYIPIHSIEHCCSPLMESISTSQDVFAGVLVSKLWVSNFFWALS